MTIDPLTVLAGVVGLVLAVSFAVLAGVVTARVLFHASRVSEEEQP